MSEHPQLSKAGFTNPPLRARQAAAALLLAAAASAQATSQVFLVQNSGWMESFYTDPASQYKPLVTEVVLAAVQPGDALVLASFNQSQPGAPSPKALLATKVEQASQRAAVQGVLAPLAVAKKPGSTALADTDLGEAVSSAIGTALGNKPGLVWLFTNNKNSPNNDQATSRRNREFYELIHHGAAIKKALAFPLHMPVKGRYSANGLMIYVFAIGDEGARDLDKLLRSGRLQQVITETPARLKPLDQDTVRLTPVKVENVPGVAFSTQANGVLRADIDAGARGATASHEQASNAARIGWRLENTVYPYTITSARLEARSLLAGAHMPILLGADAIAGLSPGKPQPLSSAMQLPVAHLPGKWSLDAVKAAGSAAVLPGAIEVKLSEQKLELSQAFRQRMASLFPGDPLPDIFTPPEQVQGSRAVLPLEVRIRYGVGPLLGLLGGAAALLAAAAGLAVAATRTRKVWVTIEGEPRVVHAKPGAVQPLHDRAGNKVAELHASMFGTTLTDVRQGAQVRLGK
ncbi:hypothetical protein [Pseudoduganella ginsengisoli]|uniref:hypothetical protein n=1 Tax=Pseudoduganella ginsengisoli TaxID=1462440 RepID=UPI001479465D|nr:hypothetical protein [Pseudoduganella ginsengisoli]